MSMTTVTKAMGTTMTMVITTAMVIPTTMGTTAMDIPMTRKTITATSIHWKPLNWYGSGLWRRQP